MNVLSRPMPVAEVLERIALHDAAAVSYLTNLFDRLDDVDTHDGDLEVASLELEVPLVVFGALRVTGNVTIWEHAHLIVLGDLRAAALGCTAALHARGNLEVDQLVYLASGNDYRVTIGGDVIAALVIEDGSRTTVGGRCTATIVSAHNVFAVSGAQVAHVDDLERTLRPLLGDELFAPDANGNGGLHENLLRALSRGERVLVPDTIGQRYR